MAVVGYAMGTCTDVRRLSLALCPHGRKPRCDRRGQAARLLEGFEVAAPPASAKQRAAIPNRGIAPVVWRQQARQVTRQAICNRGSVFVERTDLLRFTSEKQIGFVAIDENLWWRWRHPRQVGEMEAVVRLQPDVGDQPVIGRQQETMTRSWHTRIGVNDRQLGDGVAQFQAQHRLGFDDKEALK